MAKALPAKIKACESNRPAPVHSPPPPPSATPLQPAQTGFDAGTSTDASDVTWPPRRALPKLPDGEITQAVGIAYCKKLCAVYPEVFDNGKGCFRGATATMLLKPGGLEEIIKSGPRPQAKKPYGLDDQFEPILDKLYEDLDPIDGKDLITASQIVPVIENKNGERVLKRLAINYKSTVNQHLEDIPDVFTTCTDELAKVAGEYRTCLDLSGAFKQIPIDDMVSRKLLAVVTPRGYAIPKTLMFGVKTSPAIFNANMRKLIHSCNGKGPVKCAQMVGRRRMFVWCESQRTLRQSGRAFVQIICMWP